jgi:hypothetical protein
MKPEPKGVAFWNLWAYSPAKRTDKDLWTAACVACQFRTEELWPYLRRSHCPPSQPMMVLSSSRKRRLAIQVENSMKHLEADGAFDRIVALHQFLSKHCKKA